MQIRLNQKSGLGNQLFQYAAGLYFARHYEADLMVLREPAALAQSHGYPRPFLLQQFAITAAVRERQRWDRLLCSAKRRTLLASASLRALTGTAVFREAIGHQWRFEPDLPLRAGLRTLYLEGYWQSHQYAAALEAELRRQFSFRQPAKGRDRELLAKIAAGPGTAVSLHMRRGDYTLAAEGNPALGMDYYQGALKAIHERVADPVFYVFSDDIAYAREHLPRTEQFIFVEHNNEQTAHEDLRLMAACRHHVIANSSFSWWGAWLNPREDKIVLAPSRWTDPKLPPKDLLPSAWRRIPA